MIAVLAALGYEIIRQKGSHVRLRHEGPPSHSITVPRHTHLKAGTLHAIVNDVATARAIEVKSILSMS
ncbi:type II toxin-antitoxin system HicA family toxin [Paludibaculum fermentans]|uniref:type II toxin-antitoxin system HicA family toxin n=1 Tax=Paludibaculum fermentans TaxID=1473598 RepID=UPI003898FDEB